MTDVQGELSNDLKARIYHLEGLLAAMDRARSEAEASFNKLKQEQAVELATLRAQVSAKSKIIATLQVQGKNINKIKKEKGKKCQGQKVLQKKKPGKKAVFF